MKYKIFVDFAPSTEILTLLEESTVGHELVFPRDPVTSVLHMAPWDTAMETADILFGQPETKSIAKAKNLKWIHISSSGITRYDNSAFREQMALRNIMVSNSASVYSDACADHVLSFMLAQSRQLPPGLITRAAGGSDKWTALRSRSIPLRGQTVLIVGFGAIGARLVELLAPYNMTIKAFRRNARGDENVPVVRKSELFDVLVESDHVINILPESEETVQFFNTDIFNAFKPGSIFYNIGRGSTVDQDDLLEALRGGKMKAAWLDVTSPEPLPDSHPLWTEPNCFITPHVAGGHFDETKTLVQHFCDNFRRFVENDPLVDRVM